MRRPAWGGHPPADDEAARELILEAARRAALRDGLANTSVASIAREAGITRQTFYRYFADGQHALRNAELRIGGGLVEVLLNRSESLPILEDRLVDAILFLANNVPKDPFLSRHLEPARAGILMSDAALQYAQKYVETIWTDEYPRPTRAKARALAELQLRWLHSFVVLPRSQGQLKRFVETHVRPAIRGWLEQHARA